MSIPERYLARLQMVGFLATISIFSLSFEMAISQASTALNTINSIPQPAKSDPHLICDGSGELSGQHPGWSDPASQQITVVPLGNSNFGVYWCPATAPNGIGQISYTVTSPLGAITCETSQLSCVMNGIFKSSKLTLMATDETGTYSAKAIAVANSGVPMPCVKTLMRCNPGPDARTFQTFGNLAPEGVGDCTFAAVANWEFITLGIRADPVGVVNSFNSAGGANNLGLTTDQVFNYWSLFGIAGIYAKDWTSVSTDPIKLMKSIDDSEIGAVIASLNLSKNQNFAGTSNPNSSYHWVVVDGYTPQGPLVVTWGKALQMTWQQWNWEVVSMWQINTFSSS